MSDSDVYCNYCYLTQASQYRTKHHQIWYDFAIVTYEGQKVAEVNINKHLYC